MGVIYLLGQTAPTLIPLRSPLVSLAFIFIMAFAFQPLRERVQGFVDRVFFRSRYDYQRVLRDLSQSVVRILRLDELVGEVLRTLKNVLKTERALLLIASQDRQRYELHTGESTSQSVRIVFPKENPFIQTMLNKNAAVFGDELPDGEPLGFLKTAVAIPLCSKDQLVGVLCLGDKSSGGGYSDEDIALLTTLANQLAIAVENARLHEEIVATTKQLYQADKLASLGTLAASLAHEVKNPLTIIKGMVDVISGNGHKPDPELLDTFNDVVPRQLERMQTLLNGLFRLGVPSKGEKKQIQINAVLEEILHFFEMKCQKCSVRVVKELGTVSSITADPEEMTQVFTNLVLNAIQAMNGSGGTLTVLTSAGLSEGQPVVLVEVRDTGVGISSESVWKIFDPFYTTKTTGTGLGLTICKRIVEEHGGKLRVESEVGKGTSFQVEFAIASAGSAVGAGADEGIVLEKKVVTP